MRGYSDAPPLTTSESSPWLLARRSVSDGRFTVLVLFLPPALLLFTLFVVLPIGEAAWYSGFNWNGFGRPTNWIGFDNYRFVLETRAFWLALRNNGLDHRRLASDPVAAGAGACADSGGSLSRRGGATHAVLPALYSGRDRHRPDFQLRL